MSTYEMGAFDALEWVWHILKEKGDIDNASRDIQKALSTMGKGRKVDFRKKIIDLG
ncbi:MAG: hypothetical protein ACLFVP_02370 [Candidatus Bathyarchaeia archaeon]